MIAHIGPDEIKTAKANFDSWLEIQDRKKELNDENKAIIESTARLLEVKKPIITKLFNVLKKKMEDGEDETEEVSEIIENVYRN